MRSILRGVLVAGLLAAGLLRPAPVRADTFTPGDTGALEHAVAEAIGNNHADTIDLGGKTFTLTSQLTITNDNGNPANTLTIKHGTLQHTGSEAHRIIQVGSGAVVVLDSVTLTGGTESNEGGAINNDGTLTIRSSTLSGNHADGDGGAIYDNGILTITASTLSGNTAPDGGAIYHDGTATITNSTLSGNHADEGSGGGIYNGSGTLTVTSSTLSGNTAGIGGGIYNDDTVDLKASILGGNTAGFLAPDCFDITSGGFNVVSNDTGCLGLTSQDVVNQDPKLGPLADNGGPTKTHAIPTTSPAYNLHPAADAACTGTDQRGVPRPQDVKCDSGAYEYFVPVILTAATAGTGTDAAAAEGVLSSNRDGISCTRTGGTDDHGDCTEGYPGGTIVTLTATPNRSSTAKISGDCTAGPGAMGAPVSCDVTMDVAKSVTATFTRNSTATGGGGGGENPGSGPGPRSRPVPSAGGSNVGGASIPRTGFELLRWVAAALALIALGGALSDQAKSRSTNLASSMKPSADSDKRTGRRKR
jgi:predicted outer membrane repeat protein